MLVAVVLGIVIAIAIYINTHVGNDATRFNTEPLALNVSGYHALSPEEYKFFTENNDVVVIDVHIPEQEHIERTDMVIPYDQILQSKKLPKDTSTNILLYCRSGSMSKQAAEVLVEAGYTNVYDLVGGKNTYDAMVVSQIDAHAQRASATADYIDFEAEILIPERLPIVKKELGDAFDSSVLDMTQTHILLYGNNHRSNLGDIDFLQGATLDGVPAHTWQSITSAVGGHHIVGILSFDNNDTPSTLILSGLPTDDAILSFEQPL